MAGVAYGERHELPVALLAAYKYRRYLRALVGEVVHLVGQCHELGTHILVIKCELCSCMHSYVRSVVFSKLIELEQRINPFQFQIRGARKVIDASAFAFSSARSERIHVRFGGAGTDQV